ncbi:MAG: lysylphosphatidylglycerol synthase transmembrane domain-containing protein [Phycisphaerae bacterium]
MNLKASLVTFAKIALCSVAVYLVARTIEVDALMRTWQAASKPLLAVAVGLFLLTPVLQALRLRRLLGSHEIKLGWAEDVRLAFAGNFLNFAAPLGSTSGDVFKAAVVARHASRRQQGWEAATIVIVDRAVGLGVLLLSVATIALLAPEGSRLGVLRTNLYAFSIVLLLGVLAVVTLPRWKHLLPEAWREKLPRRELIRRVSETARRLLACPRTIAIAVLTTVVLQIVAAAAFLCVALAVGFTLSPSEWTSMYAFFSTGEIVKALPGPPQGLGTMELAYAYLFADWASASQIVSAAIGIRLVSLLCALPGAMLLTEPQAQASGVSCGEVASIEYRVSS